ncbi:MAG: MBL fold metallo-hydrolase [Oscillospiraceae bacterium]|nr:MBL fold metallo-hydrolase [Oscillospiraceae bacterium]
MELTWLGHACFAVESEGYRIVLDPYRMDDYPTLHTRADAVFCSHSHADHNCVAAVELTKGKASPFTVEKLATFHDDRGGSLRGENTVHILRSEGKTVIHCGDLGHFPTDAQLAKMSGADVLLIPVGGYYTIDAATAKRVIDAAKPRIAVPMHYRHGKYGLRAVGTLDEFLKLVPAASVHRLSGSSFVLSDDISGVIVPEFAG